MIKKIFFTILISTIAWSTWAKTWLDEAVSAEIRGDFAQVVKIQRIAAEKGDADAMYLLGVAHHKGQGIPQDYVAAISWYKLAAMQDHVIAQYNLAVYYENGEGVPQNYAEAIKWYRLSARQGFRASLTNLGALYANGYGVPQDYVKAHMWLNLASARGDKEAEKIRGTVARRMPPEQILEAQKMARDCLARKYKDCD